MATSTSRWNESWRVLAYSAAAALAFVALERLELALFDVVGADRLLAATRTPAADERLAAEAAELAARARDTTHVLPAGHRAAAFRLGYELGWASEFAGSFAMSDPAVQTKAAAIADAHVAAARDAAGRIGIAASDVAALPSRTLADFVRLQERFEADESGLAARVEARLTPIDRQLFLLGAAVGAAAATEESSGGKVSDPPIEAIRRHATLAGVAPEAWQPLAAAFGKGPPEAALERRRAAIRALLAALAASETVETGARSPR